MKVYQTRKWRRLRAIKLADSPLCEDCLRAGRIESAVDCHHDVSFMTATDAATRYHLAYSYDNLISLCKTCHQRRHNGETAHEADAERLEAY